MGNGESRIPRTYAEATGDVGGAVKSRRTSVVEQKPLDAVALRLHWKGFLDRNTSRAGKFKMSIRRALGPIPIGHLNEFIHELYPYEDETFCQQVMSGFAEEERTEVHFTEFALTLCVLDRSSPAEKLQYLYQLADEPCNNNASIMELKSLFNPLVLVVLFLERQASAIAKALEELTVDLDAIAKDGRITMEQWLAVTDGKQSFISALGLDSQDPHHIVEGKHSFWSKHYNSPTFCNYCKGLLYGLGKQGLSCDSCRYTAHASCAIKLQTDDTHCCRGTYVNTAYPGMAPPHFWVPSNSGDSCAHCKKWVKSKNRFHGLLCAWCKVTIHEECSVGYGNVCSLGEFSDCVIPATRIALQITNAPLSPLAMADISLTNSIATRSSTSESVSTPTVDTHTLPSTEPGQQPAIATSDDTSAAQPAQAAPIIIAPPTLSELILVPKEGTTPICIFINPKSGANQGHRLMRKLKYLLNPRQVFDLSQESPMNGLKQFSSLRTFRVICCGGDGTVGWVLSCLDKLRDSLSVYPPVGVVPLGTGNDLARCLNWGGGYTGEDVATVLREMVQADEVALDRWNLSFAATNPSDESDPIPLTIMNNYFSIGVDASIALRFHNERTQNPQKFRNRAKNKLFYAQYGAAEALSSTCADLHKLIQVFVDDVPITLPALEGIAILNIPSMYGGSDLWGTPGRSSKFLQQHIGDSLIEVVGIYGSFHVAQIKGHVRQSAKRIAQGKVIKIVTTKLLPMQVDGEPWMQSSCTVTVTLANQSLMLRKHSDKEPSVFSSKRNSTRASVVKKTRSQSQLVKAEPPSVTEDDHRIHRSVSNPSVLLAARSDFTRSAPIAEENEGDVMETVPIPNSTTGESTPATTE